jgi:hypothetical protein
MNFELEQAVINTATALFEIANIDLDGTEAEYISACRQVLDDILDKHPDMPIELILFAMGRAFGRAEARRDCGCTKRVSQ